VRSAFIIRLPDISQKAAIYGDVLQAYVLEAYKIQVAVAGLLITGVATSLHTYPGLGLAMSGVTNTWHVGTYN
jgi:hypothetical protein